MQFQYLYTMQATGFIDVEDIGNFCLSCINDFHEEYIIMVVTEAGWTKVLVFGPWMIDSDILRKYCSCAVSSFEFNAGKIEKMVDKVLNGGALISQVTQISVDEAKSRLKNLGDYI